MLRNTFLKSLLGLSLLLGGAGVAFAAQKCCEAKDCACPAACACCDAGCKDNCCCADGCAQECHA